MYDLFDKDGHLTDYALNKLISEDLNEVERLEVSEHLSFCDKCVDRYCSLLTDENELSITEDRTDMIMTEIRRKKLRDSIRRYATAAAAVIIGCIFWYSGAIDILSKNIQNKMTVTSLSSIEKTIERATESININNSIMNYVDKWSMEIREKSAVAFGAPKNNIKVEDKTNEKK